MLDGKDDVERLPRLVHALRGVKAGEPVVGNRETKGLLPPTTIGPGFRRRVSGRANQAPTAWPMKLVARVNSDASANNCNSSPSVEKP
jgi:hypothetical protein